MTAVNKEELRQFIRQNGGNSQERNAQSLQICRNILQSDLYQTSKVIVGYMPLPREADIVPVLEAALKTGKKVALPLCGKAPFMSLRYVSSLGDLTRGAYGIPEPSIDAPVCDEAAADLVLVPLEGIDRNGCRLGKGKGYYDCLLKKTPAFTLGCALTWQIVDNVPTSPWDVPVKARVDMNGIYRYNNDGRKDFDDERPEEKQD